jgi:hypothetical protein
VRSAGLLADAPSAGMEGHLVAGLTAMTTQTLAALGIAQKVMSFSADGWVFVSAVALLRARRAGA